MKPVKGGVCAAKGFLCASARAGFRKKGDDMGLIYSEFPAAADGLFTQNLVQAAPVIVSKKHLKQDLMAQAILVNSGCANCCTGKRGISDAAGMAGLAAMRLGIKKEDVLVASTGLIGSYLDMKKIEAAVPRLVDGLGRDNSLDFAKAIMTTDTVPKEAAVKFKVGDREAALGG
ncbi:MAG: bifunctional ornithine acetyltransferase/N-acetylglutamate synthase, partial [Candidatus Omnitrophica bacterium]|nr:bifunctional ornithine acetyltransferase/N-acetylglutamate synthase [Candidatus Omnitrophota bacterium]